MRVVTRSARKACAGKTLSRELGNGVYVSAGSTLWWAELPAAGGPLSFQGVALEVPAANTIGGISFDGDTAYVPFQTGTSGKNPGGSIVTFQVTAGNPRTFSSPTTFHDGLGDTPEFLLFLAGASQP